MARQPDHTVDEQLPNEEAERRAREVAARLLSTPRKQNNSPKLKKGDDNSPNKRRIIPKTP